MNKETFNKYVRHLTNKAARVRGEKEEEYYSEKDVLESFRKLAGFRSTETPISIMDLWGKHLISISDMVNVEFTDPPAVADEYHSDELWDEKFVDAYNYLIKLYASIKEARG